MTVCTLQKLKTQQEKHDGLIFLRIEHYYQLSVAVIVKVLTALLYQLSDGLAQS
jgi:hypothetical protein